MKYDDVDAGKWVQIVTRGYRAMCCDCALVHVVDVRVTCHKGKRHSIELRVRRPARATSQARRQQRITVRHRDAKPARCR